MWNRVNVVENQRAWSSQTQIMSEFGTWWRGLRSVCKALLSVPGSAHRKVGS